MGFVRRTPRKAASMSGKEHHIVLLDVSLPEFRHLLELFRVGFGHIDEFSCADHRAGSAAGPAARLALALRGAALVVGAAGFARRTEIAGAGLAGGIRGVDEAVAVVVDAVVADL